MSYKETSHSFVENRAYYQYIRIEAKEAGVFYGIKSERNKAG